MIWYNETKFYHHRIWDLSDQKVPNTKLLSKLYPYRFIYIFTGWDRPSVERTVGTWLGQEGKRTNIKNSYDILDDSYTIRLCPSLTEFVTYETKTGRILYIAEPPYRTRNKERGDLRPRRSFDTGHTVYRGLYVLDPTRRKTLGSRHHVSPRTRQFCGR